MPDLRSLFLLDAGVVFLNHGSFGATPRPVLAAQQQWQRLLEREPVRFVVETLPQALPAARRALARTLHADPADLVYIPNATFAANLVARSLDLGPGDEVLATDHEYGACDYMWRFLSRRRGFAYVQQPLPLPLAPAAELADLIWQGVTGRTRVIFLSHITSATAARLPVEAICARARAAGILTVIDGAHAPGQIDLDLEQIGADFYFGNAHKWLLAPKGAAFLHARPERQPLLQPLVVSWGGDEGNALREGSPFLDELQWSGTIDYSAYLSVPAAIAFQEEHDWPAVRARCQRLLLEALARIGELTGRPSLYPGAEALCQMAAAELPPLADFDAFRRRLFAQYHIEIPCWQWQERPLIRLSLQGYNTAADIEALLAALAALLPEFEGQGKT